LNSKTENLASYAKFNFELVKGMATLIFEPDPQIFVCVTEKLKVYKNYFSWLVGAF